MNWVLGFTDLCWLGPTCKVDWGAWGAIGTVGAVVVALVLALIAETRILSERRQRAASLSVGLVNSVREWHAALRVAHREMQDASLLYARVYNQGGRFLEVPEFVSAKSDVLHEMGAIGKHLTVTIHLSMIAIDHGDTAARIARGDLEEDGSTTAFLSIVDDMVIELGKALRKMDRLAGRKVSKWKAST